MAMMDRPLASAWQHAQPFHWLDLLFDFEALPGRYPLTLREPRELFDNSRTLLMLSAGRPVPGLTLDPAQAERAQRAAVFFVRTAMFRPAVDHYTLLGLQPGFAEDALRDHYRLLMRMVHPDFAGSSGWPRDAAARINQAADVLGSKARRAEYDRSLAGGAKHKIGVNSLAAVLPRPVRKRAPAVWVWALGAGAGVAMAAMLVVLVQSPSDTRESTQALATPTALPAPVLASTSRAAPRLAQPSLPQVQALAPMPLPLPLPLPLPAKPPVVAVLEAPAPLLRPAVVTQAASVAERKVDVLPSTPGKGAVSAIVEPALAKPQIVPPPLVQASARATEVVAAKVFAQPLAFAALADAAASVVAVVPVVPVAALALAPVPSMLSAPPREPAPALSLADAQTAMSQLLQNMQSGRGEALLGSLDRSLRQSSGAAELVLAYNHLVGSSRTVKLGPVQLSGRPLADQLVVEGIVQLVLQDQGQPPPVRELRLRALFAQRGGQVVMTELSSGGARP